MRRETESPWRLAALLYLAMAVLALGLTMVVHEGHPLAHPSPWLRLDSATAAGASAALGLALAALVVAMTRVFVARFAWAKQLRDELGTPVRGLGVGALLALAALSSVAEEMFFRGLLQPAVGLAASSLLFGAVHRPRGPSRWVWPAWATGVGLGLGGIHQLTGSLVGALVAHAAINAANLLFLRRETSPRERLAPPGGLLGGARPW